MASDWMRMENAFDDRGSRRSPLAELDRLRAVQRNAEQLRLDALVERERFLAVEVVAARRLAGDRDLDLMAARRHIAGVDALHAAVLQSVELLEAVEEMRRKRAVDVDLHRVEPERLSFRD